MDNPSTEEPSFLPGRSHCFFWGGVFTLLGIVLFLPPLFSYFSSDDFLHLSTIMNGALPFAPTGNGLGFYRPIIGWSLWLEYQLWGLHPFGYHASNVLMHLLNSMLVAILAALLLPAERKNPFVAVGAGLIFLTMACHAEPVSWISGRTDLLATFFALLSLCALAYGIRKPSPRMLFASLVPFGLALLSKESTIALPILVLAIAVYLRSMDRWRVSRSCWLTALALGVLVLCGYFAIRYWNLGSFVGGYGVRGHLRFHQDLLAQAMSRFAWRVYCPPLPQWTEGILEPHGRRLADIVTILFFLHGLAWSWLAWKSPARRTGLFLYGAFWIALLPVINIRIYWTNSESERFLYLASLFAALGAAWAINALPKASWRLTVLLLLLSMQAFFLTQSNLRWRDASFIARDIVEGIQRVSGDEAIILTNKPDSLDGAIVFRTGLPEALHFFGPTPKPSLSVEVLFATTLYQRNSTFTLVEESVDTSTFQLTATDPDSVMVEEDSLDSIVTVDGNERRATFHFRIPLRDQKLLYYTDGEIRGPSRPPNPIDPTER